MLPEQPTSRLRSGRLLVRTLDPVLTRLLAVLMAEGGYGLVEEGASAELHLVQEGCQSPASGATVWLTADCGQAANCIAVPLAMEKLWAVTEAHLHPHHHRRHLRLATRLPAELRAGGERIEVLVGNLSDYGARFRAPRELARDDEVLLHLHCGSQALVVAGRVIYCIPMGDLDGGAGFEIGLVLVEPDAHMRQGLRDFITGSYLQRVRAALSPAEFAATLPLLRLSAGVLSHLQDPAASLP